MQTFYPYYYQMPTMPTAYEVKTPEMEQTIQKPLANSQLYQTQHSSLPSGLLYQSYVQPTGQQPTQQPTQQTAQQTAQQPVQQPTDHPLAHQPLYYYVLPAEPTQQPSAQQPYFYYQPQYFQYPQQPQYLSQQPPNVEQTPQTNTKQSDPSAEQTRQNQPYYYQSIYQPVYPNYHYVQPQYYVENKEHTFLPHYQSS